MIVNLRLRATTKTGGAMNRLAADLKRLLPAGVRPSASPSSGCASTLAGLHRFAGHEKRLRATRNACLRRPRKGILGAKLSCPFVSGLGPAFVSGLGGKAVRLKLAGRRWRKLVFKPTRRAASFKSRQRLPPSPVFVVPPKALLKDGDFICAPPRPHTPNSPSSPSSSSRHD